MVEEDKRAETFIALLRGAYGYSLVAEQDLNSILHAPSPHQVLLDLTGPGSVERERQHVFRNQLSQLLQEPINWKNVQEEAAKLLGELRRHVEQRRRAHENTDLFPALVHRRTPKQQQASAWNCSLEECASSLKVSSNFGASCIPPGIPSWPILETTQSILDCLERAGITTARELLDARVYDTCRRTALDWEVIVAYRMAARWWLTRQSWEAKRFLEGDKWWSKNNAFQRLTSGMALLVADRVRLGDHQPFEAVIQMADVLRFEDLAVLAPADRLPIRQEHAARTQAPLLAQLELTREIPGFLHVWLSNQLIGSFQPWQLLRTAGNSSVLSISPLLRVRACVDQAKARVRGTTLFGKYTGKQRIVALIDSGVDDSHFDLHSRVIHKRHYTSGHLEDDFGHGTHLAGIVGGKCLGDYSGIAPESTLWCYRTLDDTGHATQQDVTDAIQQVVADSVAAIESHEVTQGDRIVVNCSIEVKHDGFVAEDDYDKFCQPFDDACTDLVVVVAAGNYGPQSGTITAPGGGSRVLTVGASSNRSSGRLNVISPFSSRGPARGGIPKPDVVAPGGFENPEGDAFEQVSVVSSRVAGSTLDRDTSAERPWRHDPQDQDHYGLSGTSQAAALVSGLAALLVEHAVKKNGFTTHAHIADALKANARRLGFGIYEEGNGLVDADSAMKML